MRAQDELQARAEEFSAERARARGDAAAAMERYAPPFSLSLFFICVLIAWLVTVQPRLKQHWLPPGLRPMHSGRLPLMPPQRCPACVTTARPCAHRVRDRTDSIACGGGVEITFWCMAAAAAQAALDVLRAQSAAVSRESDVATDTALAEARVCRRRNSLFVL
jgi:hypothetical protein